MLRLRADRWSEGAARAALRLGLEAPSFDRAAQTYEVTTGWRISGDSVRRISEGAGASIRAMREAEVAQAHAVEPSGAGEAETTPGPIDPVKEQGNVSTDGVFIRIRGEGWKEVKVTAAPQARVSKRRAGQVSARHPAHEPVVKLERHSYQATLGDADDMARWEYVEGLRRGLPDCACVTSVNDGAAWVERITRANFPDAVQIVDWAHASQHVHHAAERAWPQQPDTAKAWVEAQLDALWAGETRVVAEAIGGLPHAEAAELVGYFSNNAERMRYAEFCAQGLSIGSGVVESGCKTVIQRRLRGRCRR